MWGNSRSNPRYHLWARCFLAYIVFSGFVPFLSELRQFGSVYGNNPNHNFELAWGLMHIVPALGGIAIALWHLQYDSVFSAVVIILLTLQALFALLEYRREGFDHRMAINLDLPHYVATMFFLALPFLLASIAINRRSKASI